MDTRNVAFKGYSYLNQSMEGKQDMTLSLKNGLTGFEFITAVRHYREKLGDVLTVNYKYH